MGVGCLSLWWSGSRQAVVEGLGKLKIIITIEHLYRQGIFFLLYRRLPEQVFYRNHTAFSACAFCSFLDFTTQAILLSCRGFGLRHMLLGRNVFRYPERFNIGMVDV